MVVVTKLPNGLDLGGYVLRGAMRPSSNDGQNHLPVEKIAGYAVTRNVPPEIWERWYGDNARGPIVGNKLVAGFADGDQQSLEEFCWANAGVRGWAQKLQG